jgi:exonuclease SbcC
MIPISLTLSNFLSHEHSEVDFTAFNVALILGSYNGSFERSNGAGKTALLTAIRWVLFEKTNHKKKDGVVKRDKKSCEVQFVFELPSTNQRYRLTRSRDKIIGESVVVLEQFEAGQYKDISCDTNTLTNQKIETIIGLNDEVFINSVYFKQNDASLFADATPGKRKDIIKALLRLDKWDAYHKLTKSKASSLQIRLEEKSNQRIPIADLKDQLNKANRLLNDTTKALADGNRQFTSLNVDLNDKRSKTLSKFGNRKETIEQLKCLTKDHAQAKKQLDDYKMAANQKQTELAQYKKVEETLRAQMRDLSETIKAGKTIDMAKISASLLTGRTKEKVLRDQLAALEKVKSECPTCRTTLTKQRLQELTKELESARKIHSELKVKLQLAEKKAVSLQAQADQATKAELERSKIEVKLTRCIGAIEALKKDQADLSVKAKSINLSDFEAQLAELKSATSKNDALKAEQELSLIERDLKLLKAKIDNLNIEYGGLTRNVKDLERQIEDQTQLQQDLDKLNDEYAIYDKLRGSFGKDGIQSVIIENVIDELENYTNDTLAKICNEPTTIAIKTQRQSDNGSWQETFDIEVNSGGRTDDLDTFSGGERFRVSLALRLALSKVLSKRMGGSVNFLLLDEVTSSLDDKGMELFMDIVRQLGNEMKVLVITHDNNIKDQFTHTIVINKTAEGSRIVKQ